VLFSKRGNFENTRRQATAPTKIMSQSKNEVPATDNNISSESCAAVENVQTMEYPKKPIGSFLLFKADVVGDRWQQMSEEQKRPFVEAYEKAKVDGAKKPASAYFRFVQSLQLSQKWRNLPPITKADYEQRYRLSAQRYKDDMKKYNAIYRERALAAPDAPKKPTPPFFAFSAHARQNTDLFPSLIEKSQQEQNKLLGDIWRSMSAEDKRRFVAENSRQREQYPQLLSEYEKRWGAVPFVKAVKKAARQVADKQQKGPSAAKRKRSAADLRIEREIAKQRKLQIKAKKAELQRLKSEKNEASGKAFYVRHMLLSELKKITDKVERADDVCKLTARFDSVEAVQRYSSRWSENSARTKQNWISRCLSLHNRVSSPTLEVDNDSEAADAIDFASLEDGCLDKCNGDNLEDEALLFGDESDDDISNYGDDGDSFVCGDDEVEYID